jgi:hypothetical protein
MKPADLSIKRKIITVTMLTSVIVLLVAVAAFMAYDVAAFRESTQRNLTTLAQVTAENSTAVLAFGNEKDAAENLSALRFDPQVIAAAFYTNGGLFVTYPTNLPASSFPAKLAEDGFVFRNGHLLVFQPVIRNNDLLGHLYMESDLRYFYERVKIYSAIAGLILFGSVIVALVLAN